MAARSRAARPAARSGGSGSPARFHALAVPPSPRPGREILAACRRPRAPSARARAPALARTFRVGRPSALRRRSHVSARLAPEAWGGCAVGVAGPRGTRALPRIGWAPSRRSRPVAARRERVRSTPTAHPPHASGTPWAFMGPQLGTPTALVRAARAAWSSAGLRERDTSFGSDRRRRRWLGTDGGGCRGR